MATLRDVATRAGVATSTVSHVLNRTRFVSPETTRAVEEAVRATGYTPNILARSLARSTSNTVGLAMSATVNRYFIDIISAIEAECSRLGMMVLLADTRDDPEEELRVLAELHRRRVDGIIFAPSADPDERALAYLDEQAIPTVLVDRLPGDRFDGVGVENHEATASLVTHLADRGHSRIALIAGQSGFTTTRERVAGFREGMRRQGLVIENSLISAGHVQIDSARDATRSVLNMPNPPTAFIGGNNVTTLGIVNAISGAGLKIPDDLAFVGFDDFEWSEYFSPRLTLLAQPCQEIGRRAAVQLQFRIKNRGAKLRIERLPPKLLVRDSSGTTGAQGGQP